jgi:CheY-like chemotaxis protein
MTEQVTFSRYVREAFAHIDDRPFLSTHPLAVAFRGSNEGHPADVIRKTLLAAIDQLRPPEGTPPGSTSWRRWRCLSLRYAEAAGTKRIARELLVSDRQIRRDHLLGLDAVAAILWARYREAEASRGRASSRDSGDLDNLESEMTILLTMGPTGPVSLVEAVNSALATVRAMAEAHGVHLGVSMPENPRSVAINQSVLRQILLCLLTASLQGDDPRGVALSVEDAADFVRLSVRIPDHSWSTPPRQAVPDEAELLIDAARRLVEAQGGTLRIDDRERGVYEAILSIPAVRLATVLVVDDNPDVAQLFRRYLAGADYRLVQARTPPTALKLAKELHPDVIILDVLMPSQDGWQILQNLRSEPGLSEVPVIICSILPERSLALSLGVADFLAKPITQRDLVGRYASSETRAL